MRCEMRHGGSEALERGSAPHLSIRQVCLEVEYGSRVWVATERSLEQCGVAVAHGEVVLPLRLVAPERGTLIVERRARREARGSQPDGGDGTTELSLSLLLLCVRTACPAALHRQHRQQD